MLRLPAHGSNSAYAAWAATLPRTRALYAEHSQRCHVVVGLNHRCKQTVLRRKRPAALYGPDSMVVVAMLKKMEIGPTPRTIFKLIGRAIRFCFCFNSCVRRWRAAADSMEFSIYIYECWWVVYGTGGVKGGTVGSTLVECLRRCHRHGATEAGEVKCD